MPRSIRSAFPFLLGFTVLAAACGYRPSLYGGGDPGDLAPSSGSSFTVLYSASCDGRCEATWAGADAQHSASFQGAWQEREQIGRGDRHSAVLTVRPVDGGARVRRAAIEVDGREVASGQGGAGTPVQLSAPLPGG